MLPLPKNLEAKFDCERDSSKLSQSNFFLSFSEEMHNCLTHSMILYIRSLSLTPFVVTDTFWLFLYLCVYLSFFMHRIHPSLSFYFLLSPFLSSLSLPLLSQAAQTSCPLRNGGKQKVTLILTRKKIPNLLNIIPSGIWKICYLTGWNKCPKSKRVTKTNRI